MNEYGNFLEDSYWYEFEIVDRIICIKCPNISKIGLCLSLDLIKKEKIIHLDEKINELPNFGHFETHTLF